MKRRIASIATIVLVTALISTAAFACDGRSRSYKVSCWKTFGIYQYAKASQSAACDADHAISYDTFLKLYYTDGTNSGWLEGGSSKKKQVPSGKVGKKASGSFYAECAGGHTFPHTTATDNWN